MTLNPTSLRSAPFALAANAIRFILAGCLFVGIASGSRAQTLSKVSVSPASVDGGTNTTGTVTLTGNAGTGGKVVALTSTNKNAVVPSSVTVSSGSKTASFTVTTSAVSTDTIATIKGALGSKSASSTLHIKAPELLSIAVNPSTLSGGTQATGTVTIGSSAPSSGMKVVLASSSSCAVVPASVTIPQGAVSGTFGIATRGAANTTRVTLRASLAAISKTTTLTVSPVAVVGVTFNPGSVVGGTSTTGIVILSGASLERTTVSLSSSSLSATVPSKVVVPAGANNATFQITTTTVTASTTATVSATLGSTSQSATLSINVLDPISNVTSALAVLGGNSAWADVTLVAPAGPGGVVVSLSSSDKSANVPATVTIGAGSSTGQFTISSSVVLKSTRVTITASTSGSNQSTKINVDPPFQIAVAPAQIIGGNPATGTVTLAGPAPSGGLSFTLTTDNNGVTLTPPASVTIPAGATSVSFQVGSSVPTYDGTLAEIQANNSDGLYSYTFITVDKELKVTGIMLSPNSVSGGTTASVQVTVNKIAPTGGYVVQLNSSAPALAKIPATVTIPAGSDSATATIATSPVSSFQSSDISATFSGSTMTTPLWVTKALPGTTYVLLNPDSWTMSNADAVSGKIQGGAVQMLTSDGSTSVQHAAFWSGTKSSFIDLHPSTWIGSYVAGVSGNVQVGNVYEIDGSGHAALWTGTAASFVDLNPPGSVSSSANAISGTTIVGNSGSGSYTYATLWNGSASNAVYLGPTDAGPSNATATDGTSTVGYFGAGAIVDSSAALWTNQSADGYVNLSPSGWTAAAALGVSGNNQVGWVGNMTWSTGGGDPYPEFFGPYAARWSGTSSSFVNLDVPGDNGSSANAISGNIAVGYVQCPGPYGVHAALWLDTASTFIDLVALAGATWTNARASAIYSDSTGITITGQCDAGAIMWHIPASELPSLRATQLQSPHSPLLP